jgi:hypothetical protein
MMDRIIFLGTGIDDQIANIVQAQLFLESADASKDIQIYLNSPGGSVYAGLGFMTRCNTSSQTLLQFVQEWQLLWSGIVVCRCARKTFCFATFKSNDSPTQEELKELRLIWKSTCVKC